VVNGLLGRLVVASVDGSLKVADVENVGRGMVHETTDLSRRRPSLVELIELVIKKENGHGFVNDPALVRVCIANVRGSTYDSWVLLVGGIVNGQGVLVEPEADLTANVLLVRAPVGYTFCIMNIAIESWGVKGESQHIVLDITLLCCSVTYQCILEKLGCSDWKRPP
jgi:hypothetical protein